MLFFYSDFITEPYSCWKPYCFTMKDYTFRNLAIRLDCHNPHFLVGYSQHCNYWLMILPIFFIVIFHIYLAVDELMLLWSSYVIFLEDHRGTSRMSKYVPFVAIIINNQARRTWKVKFTQNPEKTVLYWTSSGQNPFKEQSWPITEAKFVLSMPKYTITTSCLSVLMDLKFS